MTDYRDCNLSFFLYICNKTVIAYILSIKSAYTQLGLFTHLVVIGSSCCLDEPFFMPQI